jgi:hypothetical protein
MNDFQVASTARQAGEDASRDLFVGEMEPHNAERPWLAIRGTTPADAAVTSEPRITISFERP